MSGFCLRAVALLVTAAFAQAVAASSVLSQFYPPPSDALGNTGKAPRGGEAPEYLWLENGKPNIQARDALKILAEARSHGLRSQDYWFDELSVLDESLVRGTSDFSIEYEGLMTDALLRLFKDLRPLLVQNVEGPEGATGHILAAIRDVANSGELRRFYEDLLPRHAQYEALRYALRELELRSEEALPLVGRGSTLRVGDDGERVAALRARLLGESAADDIQAGFDAELEDAVRRYQQLHGLEADGIVGRRTQQHLDIPLNVRRAQLRLALARWRELPAEMGADYVHVNIPEYRLQLYSGGSPALEMRVVVGSREDPTPAFNDEIEYLVFNPYWHVPRRIALEELVPQAAESPGYLSLNDYEIVRDGELVSEDAVDWAAMNAESFGYRIRQRPGPRNALGAVKFLFPNELNIYLHDSPARNLYERPVRAFSHGCIRVEDPVALASALLAREGEWDSDRVDGLMAKGVRRQINLRRPVSVYLTYITAKVTATGEVAFLSDIYERDSRELDRYL